MTVEGRGGCGAACYLQHTWRVVIAPLTQQGECIVSHGTSCLDIVTTDISREVVCRCLAVEEHHGNAALLGSDDSGRDSLVFVGRHDKQVDTRGSERVNLPHLPFRVVVCIGDAHLHLVAVEVLGGEHLVVHLLPPFAADTLRHADAVPVRMATGTSGEEEEG